MKTRTLLLLVVLVALAVPVSAGYAALDQITVADTAIGFTSATIRAGNGHNQANTARCTVSGAEIMFRDDGGVPTSTVGKPAQVGDELFVPTAESLVRFLAIRTTSTSGKLNCIVYE